MVVRSYCGLEITTHGLGIGTRDFEISGRDLNQTCIPPIHGIGPIEWNHDTKWNIAPSDEEPITNGTSPTYLWYLPLSFRHQGCCGKCCCLRCLRCLRCLLLVLSYFYSGKELLGLQCKPDVAPLFDRLTRSPFFLSHFFHFSFTSLYKVTCPSWRDLCWLMWFKIDPVEAASRTV